MAVNLCAAHKKTDLPAAHEVLLASFLQLCSTQLIELACSTQKITLVSHASSVRVTRQICFDFINYFLQLNPNIQQIQLRIHPHYNKKNIMINHH